MSEKGLTRTVHDHATGVRRRKRAVVYLRVSTQGQVHTDYDPEGISLPAQREACKRKALELSADIVDKYIEPGRTATEIEKRPVFQEMMARIKAEQDVDYIIVHHFNRIFRNSIDAALAKRDLKKLNVRIVSTIVDLGDTLESQMVETILHAVDEYQVKRNNADIKYKMGQKAKKGGTITRARLGYLNTRELVDGYEVRTVIVDERRAPLIVRGFELYSTGQHTAQEVLDILTAEGLRTRATRRTPEKPVSLSAFYEMLSDRYYVGKIEHDGEEYDGRHTPLISEELYDRVQRVLALHGGGGTRERRHNHYLKGTLWCGACGKRLIIMRGKGNGGTYFYYFCRGRQSKTCDQPMVPVDKLEIEVVKHYATVRLSEEFCERVRSVTEDLLLAELGSSQALKKHLQARFAELDAQETNYIRLVGKPGWPEAKIQKELQDIAEQKATIEEQLEDASATLETGRQFFDAAMRLLSDPQKFYLEAGTSLRKAMNKVIFGKLFVDNGHVTSHELTPGLHELVEAEQRARTYYRASDPLSPVYEAVNDNSPLLAEGAAWDVIPGADLLAVSLAGHGSSKTALVDLVRHYSNHDTMATDLGKHRVALARALDRDEHWTSVRSANRDEVPWRLTDKLSEDDLACLLADARGLTGQQLAEKYGISLSSVRRLLRRHGARRRDREAS
jgi:DNA invertase Pin-like site-specific DNA recombinase/Mor family transcriptional regulator